VTTVTSGAERWVSDERARDDAFRSAGAAETTAAENAAQPESFVRLGYKPFPKQQLFHGSPAKYRLFGGAAGPGKSKALLMETCIQALEAPGANTLLLRRTFPELEQSLLLYFRRDVPRELYKSYNESKHVVTWWNDSTTRFGYCARENDVYQYQGAEFVFIGIDELTLFTLRQWQFLTSRNRCPLPGAFPCMAAATNPGNIGHSWVKSLWIDRQPASGMESPEQYDPADYEFIGAKVFDNPIYATDASYIKTLNALPTHLRRAFLNGDWDVFAGQYFDRFDPSTQVFRAEQIDWKPWWPRWISIDWGYEHPSAAYWHASAPEVPLRTAGVSPAPLNLPLPSPFGANDEIQNLPAGSRRSNCPNYDAVSGTPPSRRQGSSLYSPPGADALGLAPAQPFAPSPSLAPESNRSRVITYREHVTHRTAPRELARQIIERSLSSAEPIASPGVWNAGFQPAGVASSVASALESPREKIDAIYLSPDAFARRTDEASIADQMGDVFVAAGLPRPVPADDDRVGGWMLMYQMLNAGEWLLTDNCTDLIRTLPTLVRDSARVEDVEKMDGDDPADAARYGLKTRYASHTARQPLLPLEQRIAQRVTSSDPTLRAIQIQKARLEETRRSKPVHFTHHHRPRR
jgi:Terminase large subunit, T4likevirus-type, N-terminal